MSVPSLVSMIRRGPISGSGATSAAGSGFGFVVFAVVVEVVAVRLGFVRLPGLALGTSEGAAVSGIASAVLESSFLAVPSVAVVSETFGFTVTWSLCGVPQVDEYVEQSVRSLVLLSALAPPDGPQARLPCFQVLPRE